MWSVRASAPPPPIRVGRPPVAPGVGLGSDTPSGLVVPRHRHRVVVRGRKRAMAVPLGKGTHRLRHVDPQSSSKSVILVKLTDAALKAIEQYARRQVNQIQTCLFAILG